MGESFTMTAGELLVSLSGLPSGSAAAHLLAITTGTGGTQFVEKMFISTRQPVTTLYRKPERKAPQPEAVPRNEKQKSQSKYAYAITTTPRITVQTTSDAVWIHSTAETVFS